jgi:hypothetical protein
MCSVRLPPNKDAEEAKKAYLKLCTEDVPYNAKIEVSGLMAGTGFQAKDLEPWLLQLIDETSKVCVYPSCCFWRTKATSRPRRIVQVLKEAMIS